LYFAPHAEGVPLGIGYRRSVSKKLESWATGLRKKFDDIFSRLDTIHQRDGQSDGQRDGLTDTGRQQRPRSGMGPGQTATGQNATGKKCHQQWNLFLFSSNVVSVCRNRW